MAPTILLRGIEPLVRAAADFNKDNCSPPTRFARRFRSSVLSHLMLVLGVAPLNYAILLDPIVQASTVHSHRSRPVPV
jgi:hypothetical protein